MILFSRWEHGNKKIEKKEGSFLIEGNTFSTWKETCQFLYGKPFFISQNNYFRTKRFHKKDLDFRISFSDEILKSKQNYASQLKVFLENSRTYGINLEEKATDIRKIVYSGFAKRSSGYDPEDLTQEVFKGLLIRNKGKCPYDSTKSSLSSYVHMVASCVISNYHQKQTKHKGLISLEEDNAITNQTNLSVSSTLEEYVLSQLPNKSPFEKRIFSMIIKGFKVSEISKKMSCSKSKVSKLTRKIKELSAKWAEQQNLSYMVPNKYKD